MTTDPALLSVLQPQRIQDRCDALGRLSDLDLATEVVARALADLLTPCRE
jgi:hypothetical protein